MNKFDLKTEKLPNDTKIDYVANLLQDVGNNDNLTREEHLEKLEIILIERAKCVCDLPDKISKCRCFSADNLFILGQFYMDSNRIKKAYQIFDTIKHEHKPAMYQLSVILYDDMLEGESSELMFSDSELSDDEENGHGHGSSYNHNNNNDRTNDTTQTHNQTQSSFLSSEKNSSNWQKAFSYMLKLARSEDYEEFELSMIHSAQYNVGMAYFQGFAVDQSNTEAEKWWAKSANEGDPKACQTAMCTLAFLYSQKNDPENFDLAKAFFWHNEACGNGSLESQGALGAMYYHGIGVKQDLNAAYECLTNSSERGNVYSMGLLSEYYYKNKFFAKSFELSKRVSSLNDVDLIASETKCVASFIARGISLASFIHGRCLDLGKGTKKDSELARTYYKRSYHFDPDLCQLLQNKTTLQRF